MLGRVEWKEGSKVDCFNEAGDCIEIDWDNLGETSVEYNDESRTVDGEDTGDFDNYWNQEGVFEEATDQFNEFL